MERIRKRKALLFNDVNAEEPDQLFAARGHAFREELM
jgi:hypothetical protein